MLLRQVEVIRRGNKLWCLSEVLKFQLEIIGAHIEYTVTGIHQKVQEHFNNTK